MNDLQGKTVLVTGGGRGIGREIAHVCGREGADVAVFDRVFPDDFDGGFDTYRSAGRRIESRTVDITDSTAIQKSVAEIAETFGRIDVLVNNAGITRDRLLMRMNDEDWDAVLAVNLRGAFLVTREVAKVMARQRYGRIINISSVVGIMGNAGQANYAASKAGLIGFTKSIAKELASRNITVNAVAPGYIETDMTAVLSAEQREAFLRVIPLRRPGNPSDVAEAVLFFASDKSAYITGQVLCIDGGMLM
ncbi:MAG: 3-oxoacyl-[acyl-carrier-protein] reductase [Bacteroidota bacterium]|nr:3-oxoacyl-[acyl-carrier-protein] reductase [Bacteroidota bacterium]